MYKGGKAVTFAQEIAEKGWVFEMDHAGFKTSLMKAKRLEDDKNIHGLPSGERIPVFPIASLPGAPKEWVREAGTYVVPVDTDWGLWFDWTMNDHWNTAILSSVKGMDPITGRKLEGFNLEQYVDKCPKHGKPFIHGRYCEECEYEWPPQNYLCRPYPSYWDGFRQPDGSVRQFFFTDEDARDIASLVIGKENVVPAFGFAFFKPKEQRILPQSTVRYGGSIWSDYDEWDDGVHHLIGPPMADACGEISYSVDIPKTPTSHNVSAQAMNMSFRGNISEKGVVGRNFLRDSSEIKSAIAKEKKSPKVAVGAGAKIRQNLVACTLGVDGWKPEPTAVIRLYFCFDKQFRNIVKKGGIKEFVSKEEGYLDGLPVG